MHTEYMSIHIHSILTVGVTVRHARMQCTRCIYKYTYTCMRTDYVYRHIDSNARAHTHTNTHKHTQTHTHTHTG